MGYYAAPTSKSPQTSSSLQCPFQFAQSWCLVPWYVVILLYIVCKFSEVKMNSRGRCAPRWALSLKFTNPFRSPQPKSSLWCFTVNGHVLFHVPPISAILLATFYVVVAKLCYANFFVIALPSQIQNELLVYDTKMLFSFFWFPWHRIDFRHLTYWQH